MVCGEETERECVAAISGNIDKFFRFYEVRGITPASKALNEMLTRCDTDYLVPLDADMILYPGYEARLRGKIEENRHRKGWHSILFPLWDTLTREKIMALKIFNMSEVRKFPYKDDPCPDILHYREFTDGKLEAVDCIAEDPIGDHVVRGNYYCYAKYRDLYNVHRVHPHAVLPSHFKGGNNIKERAENHRKFFAKMHSETGNEDYRYCLAGMADGLTSPKKIASKNLKEPMRIPIEDADRIFEQWHRDCKVGRIFL